MPITVVFDPPLPSDSPEGFNSKAFSTLGDLNDWSTEANALASDVTAKQTTASAAATTATTQAGIATSAASTASTKASEAVNARDIAVQAASDAEDAAAAAALFDPANYVAKAGSTMTGNLNVPSINGGQLAGMRNKIINGAFAVNQRGYVSGAATTAGQYTLDRWKVTGTGGITFSTTNNKTTVTIPSGQTLQQVIEGLNLQTGTYVLSWEGTAQGRIAGGSYGASGSVTASITGGANTTIEFNAGTVTNVQLELGTIETPFEHRPYGTELALCQRYYEITRAYILGYNTAGNSIGAPVYWSEKRVTPSAVYGAELATGNATSRAIDSITKTAARAFVNPVATGPTLYSAEIIVSAEL